MNKERYQSFRDKYLGRFTKYYIEANNTQRKEVKRSIFENINLTIEERETFWNEVIENAKGRDRRSKTIYSKKGNW